MAHDGVSIATDEAVGPASVGTAIRAARMRRRMTLRQLSAATGLSESFLSQFERGLSQASVASLRLITSAVGITLADAFSANATAAVRVMRESWRPTLPFGSSAMKFLLTPQPLRRLEVFAIKLEPNGSTGETRYAPGDSEELLLVTSGAVKVELASDLFLLEAGDSVVFCSDTPHRVVNVSPGRSEVLWVISSSGDRGAYRP
ncbi:cupin domain-containing protein [Planosporangium flavigriseum]|uniref:HTH cro/C1-type domain-containing protein n=1 Tax=Planosporangium flavigriseum TaxID=373681 RepID=A0A8J3PMP7_9ACTN|nr:XRE family transcriptional regulator [Planosporangium flavigriseum]NJC62980.1 cupin domain-containing protein [Planosporangium flavigriseum]GIG73151.1 hypothetical protein Pfl04_15550 [Planosporangium flavigriseum]